ncbi:cytochrome P450 [Lentinula edodes]|nr:cytochrome P450 [Lentinula edodes]
MGFILVGVTALTLLVLHLVLARNRKQLPPGPRGLPILGNVLELATASQIWLIFDRWKYQYGPIMYLNMAGKNIVVLNTQAAATELLERRSANYSDRPKNVVAEYLGSQLSMPFARYGKPWQSMRRAGHAVLNARVSTQYQPVQIEEAIILAHDLLCDTSSPLLTKINRSASTILSVIYGKQSLSLDSQVRLPFKLTDTSDELRLTPDPLETLSNIAHRFTNALYPGAYLVDVLPIFDYLPATIAKWKKNARKDFSRISAIFETYFDDAMRNDQHRSSLCVSLTEDQVAEGLSDVEKAWVAGSLSVAALETTSTTLMLFLYAMVLHPSVQQHAQRELDRVVLRWQPAIPLAVPHTAIEDDWYEGYFIPKGTACIPNVWSMNRDRDIYGPDADQFRPERFLQQTEKGTAFVLRQEYEVDDGHCAYGFGRRVCLGRHVADNALFIDICMILWALCIEPETPTGPPAKQRPSKDILIAHETPSSIPDFQCRFLPRFPEAEGIIQNLRDELGGNTAT